MARTKGIATSPNQQRWNNLSLKERISIIKKDKSMRDPHWAGLVKRLSETQYENLSHLEKDAVDSLLTK